MVAQGRWLAWVDEAEADKKVGLPEPGILIPYIGLDGKLVSNGAKPYMRLRLDQPKGGMKYYSPKGSALHLYIPTATRTLLAQATELVVVEGNDHPALFSAGLTCAEVNWVAGDAPPLPLPCEARIRHRQPLQACELRQGHTGLEVHFESRQRAVTPGQSVAFYLGDECLGGALIECAMP